MVWVAVEPLYDLTEQEVTVDSQRVTCFHNSPSMFIGQPQSSQTSEVECLSPFRCELLKADRC